MIVNQGREGMLKQGRNCQETILQTQGRVLVPPKGIHITMSLGAFKMSAFFIPEKNRLFSSVQLLSCVRLFETPWTAAHQTSRSNTNSRSLHKLISIESVMPSNHLISHLISSSVVPFSSHLQYFPPSGSFQMSQFFSSGDQNHLRPHQKNQRNSSRR